MTIAFRKLLVPVSFDEVSFESVELAGGLSERDDGEVFLVHVIPAAEIPFPQWPYHLRDLPGEEQLGVEVAAKRRLRSIAETHLARGTRSRVRTRIGDAAERILEEQHEIGADLIVLPTRGRRGMARLILGSVAEAVVRGASCPVLTVRGDGSSASGARR